MVFPRRAFQFFLAFSLFLFSVTSTAIGNAKADSALAVTAKVSAWKWIPPTGGDTFDAARTALQAAKSAQQASTPSEFELQAHQAAWYALELRSESALPMVLELTHPSIRSADLYLPQDAALPVVMRSGRYVPAHLRANARFPATLQLPAHVGTRTVYLRLSTIVPVRGDFLYNTMPQWAAETAQLHKALAVYLAIALLAGIYACYRAITLRSKAYALYAGLTLSIALTAMFISGYGEAWVWPFIAPWRGELTAAFACISTGLVLLLAQRAFTMDVQAPKLSRWLLALGFLCPLLGIGGAAFDLTVHKTMSEICVVVAILMGLWTFWFAWHTTNRPAMWFLMGYTPVIAGSSITTLAFAGLIPFMPWVLLSMPVGCVLEVPFNLYALYLLEKRRMQIRKSLLEVTLGSALPEESHQAMERRLSTPAQGVVKHKIHSFMLLRFEALAPGSNAVGQIDAVALEQYLHAMMATALRSASQVGRWSFNELALRLDLEGSSKTDVEDLMTSLFSQALRGESFGMGSRDSELRIAYAFLSGNAMTAQVAFKRLASAFDDPAKIGVRRIRVDLANR